MQKMYKVEYHFKNDGKVRHSKIIRNNEILEKATFPNYIPFVPVVGMVVMSRQGLYQGKINEVCFYSDIEGNITFRISLIDIF